MAAAALLATAACGGADDQEISTGADGQASSSDTAAADEADAADVGTSDSGTSANELEGTGDDDSAFSTDDSTEEDLPEAPTDDDPSGDGETSSASSGDEDYGDSSTSSSSSGSSDSASSDDASAASSSSDETDDASDLDDTVSVSNDGSGDSDGSNGGQGTSGGEQPVVQPDGTTTFGPQRGEREQASITHVQRVVRESWPLQLAVIIAGELRDGCQDLAWEMTPDGTTYRISVWQVEKVTEMACTMAIVPFETQIELGTSETEDFTVIVNGLSY